MDADNNKITCPKCNSQNIQSEGVIHLCMDCGYKWEDEVQTDFGEMIIYQSDEGVKLDVRLENKTVWLNIEQIAQLFNKGRATISEHISNIFKEGELEEKVVCRKFRQTTQHGALEGKTQSLQSASQKVQKLSEIQECLAKKLAKSVYFSLFNSEIEWNIRENL